jgi:hypothetical protein
MENTARYMENVKNLVRLITENPSLRVVPMVDSELLGDEWHRYMGSIGESKVDEIYSEDERIYFRSTDEEELIEQVEENIELDYQLNDDEISNMAINTVNEYEWEKVIVLEIDT